MAKQVQKIAAIFGATGKVEASYGAGGVLVGGDAILLVDPADLSEEWINLGMRTPRVGAGGAARKGQPGGRGASVMFPVDFHGLGTAYSATDFVPDIHTLLRISGHTATFAALPTPQWTFTPEQLSTLMASGVFDLYSAGELFRIVGVYANMNFRIGDAGYWSFQFPAFGIPSDAVDAVVPALSPLGALIIPPAALDLSLSIGAFGAAGQSTVRSVEFAMNREITPRTDHSAGYGHAGYAAGQRNATLTIVMEATALAPTSTPTATALDPYKMFKEATVVPINFGIPGPQYNRLSFNAPYAQMSAWPTRSEDGQVQLWTTTWTLGQSAPGANDEYQLKAN